MARPKDPNLEVLSVKLPKTQIATLRRLAKTQGRLLQFVTSEVIASGLLAKEKGK